MTNFGKHLKELRTQAGLTQGKLAKRLGVSTSRVSNWEQGQFLPDVLAVADIADELECSINELAGRAQPYDLDVQQKPIGDIMREKRSERHITQDLLSDLAGICIHTVRNWEQGKSYPNIEEAAKMADVFGCSIDELVGRKVKK